MRSDLLEVHRMGLELLGDGIDVPEAALERIGVEDRGRPRLVRGPQR